MILLIGYGNPLRRDDGAGPALARLIEARGGVPDLKVLTVHQLVPELAEELAAGDVTAVLFLDASVGNCHRGAAVALHSLGNAPASHAFGHQFSPEELVCYAELLRNAPLPAWQITVPGIDFGYGEGLSGYSRKNLAAAFEMMQDFLLHIPPR